VDGGDHLSYFNIINNYFKPGPVTPKGQPIAWRILKPESERSKTVIDHFGKAYVAGNITEGNEKVSADNWAGGVQPESKAPVAEVLPTIRTNTPFPHAPLEIIPAGDAYEYVLANAGATLPIRDAVDERIVRTVRTGKVTFKDGIITEIQRVGGYPDYAGTPYPDADADGMPDEWERKYGLNPADAADTNGDLNGDGYTNVEEFINGRDPTAKAG
jgi:hypothetical protein